MIDRAHDLPITKQAAALTISRGERLLPAPAGVGSRSRSCGGLTSCIWSPPSVVTATGTTARVWDVATAKEIAILSGHENTEDVVIKNVLVDAGAEPGRAHGEGHYNYTAICVIFATLQTFCETALVKNQIFVLCRKSTTDGGVFHEITGR